jgi:hypothetical protein
MSATSDEPRETEVYERPFLGQRYRGSKRFLEGQCIFFLTIRFKLLYSIVRLYYEVGAGTLY